ncbi:MAG: hypothetical protein LBC99_01735 [Spirochaetota bacterium]|nr:hypothetical protein [Spirochaetota bacterium]
MATQQQQIDEEAVKEEKLRNKQRFNDSIKKYRADIDEVQKHIKGLEKDIKTKNDTHNGYRQVIIAMNNLKLVAYYCNMNKESMAIMNIKNENYLNDARKVLYQVLINIESVVTNYVDIPPSEIEEKVTAIARLNPERKLNLLNNIGFHIQMVVDSFGDNSKWKWSFVEVEGRYAVIAKNLIDYRQAIGNNDPRKPYYVENINLMRLTKELLERASKRYRDKYEQVTKEVEDIKKSIAFLSALRRIAVLTGESEEAAKLKRMIDITTKMMESGLKKKEGEKKESARKK